MGNPLPKNLYIGTLGELLVQIRLLEFGVQAAPPIKDSGNDLIGIKGEVVKFIQVKTTGGRIRKRKLPRIYHIAAHVKLEYSGEGKLLLDKSKIFVFKNGGNINEKRELSQRVVDEFWQN